MGEKVHMGKVCLSKDKERREAGREGEKGGKRKEEAAKKEGMKRKKIREEGTEKGKRRR